MEVIRFLDGRARPVLEYASRGVSATPVGSGEGVGHVYSLRFASGGVIGPHVAGFGQLLLVVAGSGWVSAADGVRRALSAGEGAWIGQGELHAKGSDEGMTALMIQLSTLHAAAEVLGRDPDG